MYGDKLKVVDTTANGAWYSHDDGGVSFNKAVVQSGNSYKIAFQNAFHEFSHMMDDLIGGEHYFTDDPELYKLIKSDGKAFEKLAYKNQGYDKTPEFSKDYFLKKGAEALLGTTDTSVLGGVSDILESTSRISYPLGAGHGTSYWGTDSSGQRQEFTGTEFMSHYMESHCAKDGYKDAMKTVFPNACSKLEEKIWGVIK